MKREPLHRALVEVERAFDFVLDLEEASPTADPFARAVLLGAARQAAVRAGEQIQRARSKLDPVVFRRALRLVDAAALLVRLREERPLAESNGMRTPLRSDLVH